MMLLFLFLAARAADATAGYVDCSSTDAVSKVTACQAPYNVMDGNSSATACAYFTNMATCIPVTCCRGYKFSGMLPTYTSALKTLGLSSSCEIACGGTDASSSTDLDCDSTETFTAVFQCTMGLTLSDAGNQNKACAYYHGTAACVPLACCGASSYAGRLASEKKALVSMGLGSCNPMCGVKLSRGTHAMVSSSVCLVVMALSAVFYIIW